ncbi:hypothetical protein GIB67_001552, partial [Kingdonia uniflora]
EEIRGYGQPLPSVAASYGSGAEGTYQPLLNSYGGNSNFITGTIPPPTRYTSGPNFYPTSYGGPPSYSGDGGLSNMKGSGERGQHDGGYDGAQNIGGGYGGTPPSESPVKVKQCDESCGDSCNNSTCLPMRIPMSLRNFSEALVRLQESGRNEVTRINDIGVLRYTLMIVGNTKEMQFPRTKIQVLHILLEGSTTVCVSLNFSSTKILIDTY